MVNEKKIKLTDSDGIYMQMGLDIRVNGEKNEMSRQKIFNWPDGKSYAENCSRDKLEGHGLLNAKMAYEKKL